MPCFALANKVYRGCLPEEFRDFTWIEERVCVIYSNTAVVTRLCQPSDPSQPTVFHGNTCAHEMNVSSMANVLPQVPSDVNDLLTSCDRVRGRREDTDATNLHTLILQDACRTQTRPRPRLLSLYVCRAR